MTSLSPPRASSLPARRTLGRTGLQVFPLGLGGAWLLGRRGTNPLEVGVATVRQALKQGVNYLDTAACYIGGRSEKIIGAALEEWEGEVVIATKFGHVPCDFDYSREAVLASVRASLQRLRRPPDVLQLHTPPEIPLEWLTRPGGVLEGMREARERGWCRFWGVTGRDVEFLRRCLETEAFDVLLLFDRYDLLDQSGEALINEAHAQGVGVVIGSPLRMGLFGSARETMLARLSPQERRRVERLEARCRDVPGGITTVALQFPLRSPAVSVVLCGASHPGEVEDALKAIGTLWEPSLWERFPMEEGSQGGNRAKGAK